jgi:hypothetical protein
MMETLGRFGGAGVVLGVLAALVVAVVVIARWIRSRRAPAEPADEANPGDADYLDSSHILRGPPLRRDGRTGRRGDGAAGD